MCGAFHSREGESHSAISGPGKFFYEYHKQVQECYQELSIPGRFDTSQWGTSRNDSIPSQCGTNLKRNTGLRNLTTVTVLDLRWSGGVTMSQHTPHRSARRRLEDALFELQPSTDFVSPSVATSAWSRLQRRCWSGVLRRKLLGPRKCLLNSAVILGNLYAIMLEIKMQMNE